MNSPEQVPNFKGPLERLKYLLKVGDPEFFKLLQDETGRATRFDEVLALQTLKRRAERSGLTQPTNKILRLAIVGGCSLRPLGDLIEHFTSVLGEIRVETWIGDYDNYVSEIMDEGSGLYAFRPELVFILPSERRCKYLGALTDSLSEQQAHADRAVFDILSLCNRIHNQSAAEVVIGNFRLPPHFDLGPMRSSSLASDYGFRKYVNMQLGLRLPSFMHLCDIEFLANRMGTLRATDERIWYESKQFP